uniref:S5-3 n=1 Tax=Oryza sativa TaxID=4530 RepID=J9XV95_ORYSA|nr:S5-3 [Oryza sativa]
MGRRRLLLSDLLLLLLIAIAVAGAAAAIAIPRAAPAFGVETGWPPEHCLRCFAPPDAPFVLGAAAAIHLGNTNSCIAGYDDDDAPLGAKRSYYQFCIPSWVALAHDNGTVISGEAAMNRAALSPSTAVSAFMRLLHRRVEDDVVKREIELVPYKFTKMLGWVSVQLDTDAEFSVDHLAGILISHLKHTAEAHLGRHINNAVITLPSRLSYSADGRQVLSSAAKEYSGFRAVKVVDEHIAAAAAYGHHTKQGDRKAILVFHLGGRTSHATIFKFVDGTARLIATRAHHFLGGDDFTARIVDHMVEHIKEQHGRDVRQEEKAMVRLRVACEHAKKALSEQQETLVQMDSLLDDGAVFSATLTRAKFEELNHDLLDRAMALVKEVVVTTGGVKVVDEVLVVGGSARIPKVRQLVKDYFNGNGNGTHPNSRGCKGPVDVEPEDAVLHGAALLSRPLPVAEGTAAARSIDFDHWFRGRHLISLV